MNLEKLKFENIHLLNFKEISNILFGASREEEEGFLQYLEELSKEKKPSEIKNYLIYLLKNNDFVKPQTVSNTKFSVFNSLFYLTLLTQPATKIVFLMKILEKNNKISSKLFKTPIKKNKFEKNLLNIINNSTSLFPAYQVEEITALINKTLLELESPKTTSYKKIKI